MASLPTMSGASLAECMSDGPLSKEDRGMVRGPRASEPVTFDGVLHYRAESIYRASILRNMIRNGKASLAMIQNQRDLLKGSVTLWKQYQRKASAPVRPLAIAAE